MNVEEFVARYGAIYEHSPWVAEQAHAVLDGTAPDNEVLARLMANCVDNASSEAQLNLIRAHPDLAGRAEISDPLTAESSEEQARAGLDRCSAEEYEQFQLLNSAYKKKFGFPFIMAVRDSRRTEILAAFRERLQNSYDAEFETALQEIHKIARLRLAAMESAP
jgi:OHCU decarboxylase